MRSMRRYCSLFFILFSPCLSAQPPNIILIYADDLVGLQHSTIKVGEDSSLPLTEITLPQRLKKLGYETHMIGKWHLGTARKENTPTFRGFDTYFGYLNGNIDYYDYTGFYSSGITTPSHFFGIDLYNGTRPVKHFRGKYATYAFADRAVETILSHDTSKPLFMYLSHLAVHTGNDYKFLQAPSEIISNFKYIDVVNRRIFAAMVSVLDQTVGTVFKALHQRDMLNNSIIMFASDNGGEIDFSEGGYASNFPLRGEKMTNWEGGIRVPALIWSPLLKLKKPRISKQLMHVSDWLPTLYFAAGGNLPDLGAIDGYNMWQAFTDDLPSPRWDLLNTLDPIEGVAAYRSLDLKVLSGSIEDKTNGWHGPSGLEDIDKPTSLYKWVFQDAHIVKDILLERNMWIVKNPDYMYDHARVICERPPPISSALCVPNIKPCLFNISADPCEYIDLSDKYPEIVTEMMNVISDYHMVSMTPQSKDTDYRVDPACHDFTFVPWLDPEYDTECDYTYQC